MHQGKTYPFHPTFWVCWNYFWPGYMPWKMSLRAGNLVDSTHIFLGDPPYPVISQPGEIITHGHIRYTWPITWPAICDSFALDIFDDLRFVDQRWVDWHAQGFLGDIMVQEGWLSVDEPQYSPQIVGEWQQALSDHFEPITGDLDFIYATYAQGGSPWTSS